MTRPRFILPLLLVLLCWLPGRVDAQGTNTGRIAVTSFLINNADTLDLNGTYTVDVTLQNVHNPALPPDSTIALSPNNPITIRYKVLAGGSVGQAQTLDVYTPFQNDSLAPGDTILRPNLTLVASVANGFAGGGNIIVVWPSGFSVSLEPQDTFELPVMVRIVASNPDGRPAATVPVIAFPNPANEQLSIASPDMAITEVRVLDAAGRQVSETLHSHNHTLAVSLNTQELPTGVYLVVVGLADGSAQTFRIIRE